MANPVGRPPKFKSTQEMQEKIDQYFLDCRGEILLDDDGQPLRDKNGKIVFIGEHPPTVTGLALALGFTSRQALLNYQGKREFSDTVLRAKMRVEAYAEEQLFDRNGFKGAEFTLKHNFRWETEEKKEETMQGGIVLMPLVENETESES